MREDTEKRFAAIWAGLIEAAGPSREFVLGVSGGGDSLALLQLVSRIHGPGGVHAVHIDHGLAPESASWAHFVQSACVLVDIPCEVRHADLGLIARISGASGIEAAAREARLKIWRQCAARDETVVLGHTQDDQAETVLLRLARGSGLHGLAAMRAVAKVPGAAGVCLRPLLEFTRAELRQYLEALGLKWVEDPMNERETLARTHARAQLAALRRINSQAGEHIARAAADAAAMLDYARDLGTQLGATCVMPVDHVVILPLNAWRRLPRALFPMLLLDKAASAGILGLERSHLERISEATYATKRFEQMVPGALWQQSKRWGLLISTGMESPHSRRSQATAAPHEPELGGWRFAAETLASWEPGGDGPWSAVFPASVWPLRLGWAPTGTPLRVLGHRRPRLTRDWLKDAHVTGGLQEFWPAFFSGDGDEVAWLPGVRRGRFALVTDRSAPVVRVRCVNWESGAKW